MAIVKPQGEKLTKRRLKTCFDSNPHGAGFAVACEGKLHIEKGFFQFHDFWKHFNAVQHKGTALVHFRYATHGPKDLKNCHPWVIDDNHVLIHNGILQDFTSFNSKISDTGRFVHEVLQPMFASNPQAWKQDWAQYLLEAGIGYSKMAIMDNNGAFVIIKERLGEWNDDCWFSNCGYTYFSTAKKSGKTTTTYYPSGGGIKMATRPHWEQIDDWRKKHGISQIAENFAPKTETEKILGAPSQLGIVEGKVDMKRVVQFVNKHDEEVRRQVTKTLQDRGEDIDSDEFYSG